MTKIVEGGLVKKWARDHWPTSQCRGQGTYAEASSLALSGFTPVLFLLAAGVVLASCVLAMERIWKIEHSMMT